MSWPLLELEPSLYEERLKEAEERRRAKKFEKAARANGRENPIAAFLRSLTGFDLTKRKSDPCAEVGAR